MSDSTSIDKTQNMSDSDDEKIDDKLVQRIMQEIACQNNNQPETNKNVETPETNIETSPTVSNLKKDMKDVFVIIILAFVLTLPYVYMLYASYVPKMLNGSSLSNVGHFIISVTIGIIYFIYIKFIRG